MPIKRTLNCLRQHVLSFLLLLLARLDAFSLEGSSLGIPASSGWRLRLCSSISELAAQRDFVYTSSERLSTIPKLQGVETADFQQIETDKKRIKVYCISDLHADTNINQEWVKAKCTRRPTDAECFTILMVPGDVGSEMDRIESIFDVLLDNFDLVSFVPGNHELWKRGTASGGSATAPEKLSYEHRMAADSVEKMKEVLASAARKGVRTGPVRVSGGGHSVVVLPLYSWYHGSWDREPDITHQDFLDVEEVIPFHRKWGDFTMCSWPEALVMREEFASIHRDGGASTALADAFGYLNERFLAPCSPGSSSRHGSPLVQPGDTVLSFSHFLPRLELCPEKRFLLEPYLPRVSGSDVLREQVQRLSPHVHCFGHTHIPIDLTLDGTRYIQWPLGYSKEADKQCAPIFNTGPLLVSDSHLSSAGGSSVPFDLPSRHTIWTNYYLSTRRRPEITDQLAPWLHKRLGTFAGMVQSNRKRNARAQDAEGDCGVVPGNW